MKKLSENAWLSVSNYLIENARPLEKAIFNYRFLDDNTKKIFHHLKKYQNKDGGFGHGIEPDFTMKASSPMASSMALRMIDGLPNNELGDQMILEIMDYLRETYDENRQGWYSVTEEVNQSPHAPWWDFLEEEKCTVIDYSWGNPTAEIIGYMYRYKNLVPGFEIEKMVDLVVEKFLEKSLFESEHELYCYIRFYNLIDDKRATLMHSHMVGAIRQVMNTNASEWTDYVPSPLKFIEASNGDHFGISEELIDSNLDFIVDQLEVSDFISPSWTWDKYSQ